MLTAWSLHPRPLLWPHQPPQHLRTPSKHPQLSTTSLHRSALPAIVPEILWYSKKYVYLVFILFLAQELLKPLQVPNWVRRGAAIVIQNKPHLKVRANKVTLGGLGLVARGMNLETQDWSFQDFPSGLVVKTPRFPCREWGGHKFNPWSSQGTNMPPGMQPKKRKERDWSFQPYPHTARERRGWRLHSLTDSGLIKHGTSTNP